MNIIGTNLVETTKKGVPVNTEKIAFFTIMTCNACTGILNSNFVSDINNRGVVFLLFENVVRKWKKISGMCQNSFSTIFKNDLNIVKN